MNHADVRARMADYLEGQLALTDRALFDAHLDGCSDCAGEIAEMRATIGLLRALPEPTVPGDFSANVMRRIRAGEAAPTLLDRLTAFFESITSPRVLAPASAALLSAGFVLWGQQVGIIDVGLPQLPGATDAGQVMALEEKAGKAESPARSRTPSPASEGVQLAGLGGAVAKRSAPTSSRFLADSYDSERTAPGPVLYVTIALNGTPPHYQVDAARPAPVQIPLRMLDRTDGIGPRSMAVATAGGAGVPYRTSPGDPVSRGAARRAPASASLDGYADNYADNYADQYADQYGISAETVRSEPRSRDDWLAILEANPQEFARRLSTLTLAEQELWIDRLARHASEQGSLDRVVERLREAGGVDGEVLADDFAAVAREAAAQ